MASLPSCMDLGSPSELDAFDKVSREHNGIPYTEKDLIDPILPPPLTLSKARPGSSKFNSKRTRDDHPTNSSDTPFFSSDDISATIENYNEHRRKRQHKGNWWVQHPRYLNQEPVPRSERKKRELKRKVDSAVWMGSDETNPEDVGVERAIFESVHEASKDSYHEEMDDSPDPKSWAISIHPFSQAQSLDGERACIAQRDACVYVQQCADDGVENIDLTGRELGEVLGSTLESLQYFTLQLPHETPPSQEAYQSLTPSVRLFLGNNNLTQLPGQLYKTQDLTELSLRQNHLKQIMPAISKLKNLEVLNLSSNMLRWLPWEILQLSTHKLRTIRVHPNPFLEPVSLKEDLAKPEEQRTIWKTGASRIVAVTKVAFLDISGVTYRGSPPAPSSELTYHPARNKKQHTGPWCRKGVSRVPSLLEIALRRCSESSMLEHLPSVLPVESPSSVVYLLQYARAIKEAGGKECSVCGQKYIIPRTEWIEWWTQTRESVGALPFLRQGCSWNCTPNLNAVPDSFRDCGWEPSTDSDDPEAYV